jgi:ribosomal protein S12 methylthiotransferase
MSACPKALVDSERIITRLRAEGYELTQKHDGADAGHRQHLRLSRQRQGGILAAIGAAMNENGKVIVTGCMGASRSRSARRIRPCSPSPARRPTRA